MLNEPPTFMLLARSPTEAFGFWVVAYFELLEWDRWPLQFSDFFRDNPLFVTYHQMVLCKSCTLHTFKRWLKRERRFSSKLAKNMATIRRVYDGPQNICWMTNFFLPIRKRPLIHYRCIRYNFFNDSVLTWKCLNDLRWKIAVLDTTFVRKVKNVLTKKSYF